MFLVIVSFRVLSFKNGKEKFSSELKKQKIRKKPKLKDFVILSRFRLILSFDANVGVAVDVGDVVDVDVGVNVRHFEFDVNHVLCQKAEHVKLLMDFAKKPFNYRVITLRVWLIADGHQRGIHNLAIMSSL